jgi:hypothetical protein
VVVVVGSRHDPVATELANSWSASLCGAEDLVGPGWAWHAGGGPRTWRIAGARVDDRDVSGVFMRRGTVYPEELTGIHPDDRVYLAAEAHAFLSLVLASTSARVCNPVVDGAFGDEVLRLDRLLAAAATHDVPMRPVRLSDDGRRRPLPAAVTVEVVGDRAFGKAAPRDHAAALALAAALDLSWATFAFDRSHRLMAVSSSRAPSAVAAAALGALLGASR